MTFLLRSMVKGFEAQWNENVPLDFRPHKERQIAVSDAMLNCTGTTTRTALLANSAPILLKLADNEPSQA